MSAGTEEEVGCCWVGVVVLVMLDE